MRERIRKKDKLFSNLSGLRLFEFERTSLNLDDHVAHTKGRLAEFFENQFPTETINIALAYRAIFDEIKRKTNFERIDDARQDIIKTKGLSKRSFNEMLAIITNQRSNAELWGDASQILLSEGCNGLMLRKIRNCWSSVIIDEMDSNNEQFLKVSEFVI